MSKLGVKDSIMHNVSGKERNKNLLHAIHGYSDLN